MVKELLALDDNSRVWIYPSSTELSYAELDDVRPVLNKFLENWSSHSRSLVTYGNIFHKRFLALFVDETAAGASGCSIDSSVRFVKELGDHLNKDFFNRQKVHFLIDEEVKQYELKEVNNLIVEGEIDEDTLFFNHLVNTKKAFLDQWVIPVKDSWLKRYL